MKFPYREYITTFPGTSDFRLILRPVISVQIGGPAHELRCDALVDTGADETLLPLSFAKVLGVELDEEWTSQAAGISGDVLTMHYGDVRLRLQAEGESVAWRTTVGFVDFGSSHDEVIVLGHGGCLDYFTAVFHGELGHLELTANATLPRDGN